MVMHPIVPLYLHPRQSPWDWPPILGSFPQTSPASPRRPSQKAREFSCFGQRSSIRPPALGSLLQPPRIWTTYVPGQPGCRRVELHDKWDATRVPTPQLSFKWLSFMFFVLKFLTCVWQIDGRTHPLMQMRKRMYKLAIDISIYWFTPYWTIVLPYLSHGQLPRGLLHLPGGVNGHRRGDDDVWIQRVNSFVVLHAFVLQDFASSLHLIRQFGGLIGNNKNDWLPRNWG